MTSRAELESLYLLLEDPDEAVIREVDRKILSLGEEAIAPLFELDFLRDRVNHPRLRALVNTIRRTAALERLEAILNVPYPDIDLEAAAFCVARYGYPDLNAPLYVGRLDEMADEIRRKAGRGATRIAALHHLRTYLFGELGFGGNKETYYDPENSYINRVIETRKGIPISLSVLLLLLGRRLNLTIQGIGMPMHFLVRYADGEQEFYIDAYNSGMIIGEEQCKQMLERSGMPFSRDMLTPVSNRYILERMLRNLLYAYQQEKEDAEAENVTAFLLRVNPAFAEELQHPDDEEEGGDEEEE